MHYRVARLARLRLRGGAAVGGHGDDLTRVHAASAGAGRAHTHPAQPRRARQISAACMVVVVVVVVVVVCSAIAGRRVARRSGGVVSGVVPQQKSTQARARDSEDPRSHRFFVGLTLAPSRGLYAARLVIAHACSLLREESELLRRLCPNARCVCSRRNVHRGLLGAAIAHCYGRQRLCQQPTQRPGLARFACAAPPRPPPPRLTLTPACPHRLLLRSSAAAASGSATSPRQAAVILHFPALPPPATPRRNVRRR